MVISGDVFPRPYKGYPLTATFLFHQTDHGLKVYRFGKWFKPGVNKNIGTNGFVLCLFTGTAPDVLEKWQLLLITVYVVLELLMKLVLEVSCTLSKG